MGTVLSAITAKQLSLSNTEKHKERTQKKLIPQHYFPSMDWRSWIGSTVWSTPVCGEVRKQPLQFISPWVTLGREESRRRRQWNWYKCVQSPNSKLTPRSSTSSRPTHLHTASVPESAGFTVCIQLMGGAKLMLTTIGCHPHKMPSAAACRYDVTSYTGHLIWRSQETFQQKFQGYRGSVFVHWWSAAKWRPANCDKC